MAVSHDEGAGHWIHLGLEGKWRDGCGGWGCFMCTYIKVVRGTFPLLWFDREWVLTVPVSVPVLGKWSIKSEKPKNLPKVWALYFSV